MYGMTTCRDFNILQSFRSRVSFDTLGGEWADIRSRPFEEQRVLFQDPDVRARLVEAARHGEYKPVQPADPFKPDYDNMLIMNSPFLPNPTVAQEARRRQIDPVEVMLDVAIEHDFDIFFVQVLSEPRDERKLATLLNNPNMAMTFSDAGAHVGQVADAIQTYLLAYWVREQQAISLEQAIRMITFQPAKIWRLHDRGLLAPGFGADVTIFDPDVVAPRFPEIVYDLPGGGRRLAHRADGYVTTVVNGQVLYRDGQMTESRPGRLLRAGRVPVPA
jgi:N-acyl-D-aspartate/D-glutamate deacylase